MFLAFLSREYEVRREKFGPLATWNRTDSCAHKLCFILTLRKSECELNAK